MKKNESVGADFIVPTAEYTDEQNNTGMTTRHCYARLVGCAEADLTPTAHWSDLTPVGV